MNCPSRTESPLDHPEWNQNPPLLNADLTTRQDLNGIANSRENKRGNTQTNTIDDPSLSPGGICGHPSAEIRGGERSAENVHQQVHKAEHGDGPDRQSATGPNRPKKQPDNNSGNLKSCVPLFTFYFNHVVHRIWRFGQFVGPGFLIAVAYIDPGNYSTDVSAGAETKFALLFVVLMSNLFAIYLQSLCIKLGSVTGLNLAENCQAHLPKWLNIFLYILAEAAIIATDIAEVNYSPFAKSISRRRID